jgi:hypothetical protein
VKRAIAAVVFFMSVCTALDAYVLFEDPWPDGAIVMQLQLGSGATLIDGSSGWNAAAEDALAIWNRHLGRVRFLAVRDSTAPIADNNRYNNVFFSGSLYGHSLGSSTLALTTNWYRVSTGRRNEADVIFNSAFSWNSYRGTLRQRPDGGTLADLHRVALHEFGHVLGLNHPNEFGQSVDSIMNSSVSNLDVLQSDDLTGAAALYGTSGDAFPAPSGGDCSWQRERDPSCRQRRPSE